VGVVAGTTAPVQMTVEHCLVDDAARTWSGLHVTPGMWIIESNAGDAGGAYGWLAATTFSSEGEGAFATMDRLAARVPPGANGALAYLGPRLANAADMSPRWGGLLFPTPFIVGPVDRGHLARAALENLAFAIHANVNQLQSIAAAEVEKVYVGGGMARGRAFLPIVAGVLGKQVCHSRTYEVTALGAAMCAAAGTGCYRSLEEASREMAQRARPVDPDPLQVMEYEEHYERWRTVGEALQGMSDAL
ncbi:MAG: hypothetical protein IIC82_09495, partial [Chloroflexi bacterium]|nr:hypothetical protein [Chloroflexota bacterium]